MPNHHKLSIVPAEAQLHSDWSMEPGTRSWFKLQTEAGVSNLKISKSQNLKISNLKISQISNRYSQILNL